MTTPLQREQGILSTVVELWERDIVPTVQANHCILAARVVSEVLAVYRIDHAVYPTNAFVFNAEAFDLYLTETPYAEWPDSAWNVGVTRDSPGDGYAGHLMVSTYEHAIDLSAGQFDRPHKNINVPGPLIIHHTQQRWVTRTGGHSLWVYDLPGGAVYTFEPQDEPYQPYRAAKDWKHKATRQIVSEIVRELKRRNFRY